MNNYSIFDRPEISSFLFHPRTEIGYSSSSEDIIELTIPVEENISIGGKLFYSDNSSPSILFFHGNGEIAADYGDIGQMFTKMGINFIPVDYRGYGRSNGQPSVSAMMKDCLTIFEYIQKWQRENNYSGSFIIMGRSLGSASALEIAHKYSDRIDGLIIDSGFAFVLPLLRLLGINTDSLEISEEEGFKNCDKINKFYKPTLIIHAEFDHIIPFRDGEALYNSSKAEDKKMLKIPGANHNNIFLLGLKEYIAAIKELVDKVGY